MALLEPRKQWPSAALAQIQKATLQAIKLSKDKRPVITIPEDLRPKEGRALCIYGDAGWGREVARCKYEAQHFSDELVEASACLIRDRWKPEPFAEWIAAVPSKRHTLLVADFASRLAQRLGIPFLPIVEMLRETEPQKRMQNSAQQVRNLLEAFAVSGDVRSTPLILVDDMIDSGWTMTLIAAFLRLKGSGPVFPFVLARATAGDS